MIKYNYKGMQRRIKEIEEWERKIVEKYELTKKNEEKIIINLNPENGCFEKMLEKYKTEQELNKKFNFFKVKKRG